jgi:alkylation response protein AidB-like acyl-CoA dehydrogenase
VAEKDGDEWAINGKKQFITNGAEAKTYVVFAQTDPSAPASEGTTAFLVPHEYEGIEVTKIHEKISSRLYNNATVEYNDLRVPQERVLGEVNGGFSLGEGEQIFHGTLETSGMALGIGRRAFEDAFDYCHERVQGGTEIINHQTVANVFAGMYTDL